MPERVTFTRKSADRIAKVVKRVENMPPAEPIQQRRRAGGYTMQSLFEVTAVQTGAETVTLKRVQDTDDNLNDRSETLDVAYDPNNEPAVGDRGLIIRLGNGTRFFFRRAAEAVTRYYIAEHAYVKDDDVNTNFGYPTNANVFYEVNGAEWVSIFKFDKQVDIEPTDFERYQVVFASLYNGIQYHSTGNVAYSIRLKAIKEDFDASAITWTTWSGLSTIAVAQITGENMKTGAADGEQWNDIGGVGTGGLVVCQSNLTNIGSLNGAYGLAFDFDGIGTFNGDKVWIDITREAVGSNYAGYLEFF